ncbi:high mobility group protein 2 [Megachile rotundata]|uniref:high mobility group protein 2 n=1 Tax=Megachile rotundata TaxID=143995 RepID=UPI000258E2A2|nr:PREDICTED: high mobility group protein 20A isoform X1 [Megachile rotundata]XP_012139628.1 PREDICTED: high mobility group protein 20A isoform X1 [Megachile rotundata]XP_012139629.1 PREDICTED: high mobility group protein 20A isoform X1 [Megachile rotundata]XP_012139630.1 PREDICTED: high mobility group protein 20A isoform X1 [Megachile rotundata]
MSEIAPINDVPESNGGPDQPTYNGETEEHTNKSPGSGEDKTPDSICDNGIKKNNATSVVGSNTTNTTNRAKKRKKTPRDATAPKQPLTGYFRFLNDRREKVRNENPTLSFAEITKLLASEWSNLPADQKQQYLDAAEQDKERYNREFSDYKQTEAYRLFSEKQSSEKQQENRKERNGTDVTSEQNDLQQEKDNDFTGFDIPIFTEEFLDHNKACEAELRQLRKATSDYEAQNAVLQRHVDSLYAAVNRLESETNQQRTTNQALQRHLDSLRSQLAGCFATIPLPGTNEGATLQNIDNYVERLESLLSGNAEQSLRNAVRNAVSRLELSG